MLSAIQLLTQVRDGLRRLDATWCSLNEQKQITDEELDELIGEVEEFVDEHKEQQICE
jgi:hypothetical protein